MVEERIVDGYRIAELLASEVDGRTDGPLGQLAVANPDRAVEGTEAGERAYDVRVLESDRDPRRAPTPDDAGERLARVFVHVEGATVGVHADDDAVVDAVEAAGLDATPGWRGSEVGVHLRYGAQVKRAADVLAATVAPGSSQENACSTAADDANQ